MLQQNIEPVDKITNTFSSWGDTLIENLPNLGIAIIVLIASYLLSKLIYRLTLKITYKRIRQTSVSQLISTTFGMVSLLGSESVVVEPKYQKSKSVAMEIGNADCEALFDQERVRLRHRFP